MQHCREPHLWVEEVADRKNHRAVDDSENDVRLIADARESHWSDHHDHEIPDPNESQSKSCAWVIGKLRPTNLQ